MNILIISTINGLGGGEIHAINHYKELLTHNYNVYFLALYNSPLAKALEQEKLKFFVTPKYFNYLYKFKNIFTLFLSFYLKKLCVQNNITLVHCNCKRDTRAAKLTRKLTARKLKLFVIYTHHIQDKLSLSFLKNINGIIGVNPEISQNIINQNKHNNLNIKEIIYIPPFINQAPFINFHTTQTREEFFLKDFGVTLSGGPILCMIAHFYKNISHKNHPLLLQAIKILVQEKNRSLDVMLVGDGPNKKLYKSLVDSMGISKYIHFLEVTSKIPEILFYSDIKVLTSNTEGLPIVYVEAALMKKPIIGATAVNILLFHEKTGLVFEKNNVNDLVTQIERLLADKNLRETLGQNAYNLVTSEFTNKSKLIKHIEFYNKVIN
jgi:glycosyltransferase involved in cell wall biosynthesis